MQDTDDRISPLWAVIGLSSLIGSLLVGAYISTILY